MRIIFIALLVLGAIIGLTLLAQQDPGYVLVNYRGWSVESSLSLLLIVMLLGFVVFHVGLRLLSGTWKLPKRLASLGHSRRANRSHKLTNQGLIALAEGNWAQAEKKLSRGAEESDTPLINYLGAARAAQKQGAEQRRDDYLSQAYQSMPDAELAVGLTQADVQLSQGQAEQALATLHHLRSIAPKHAYVLYLLKKLYEKLQSWDELYELLPQLQKHNVLEEAEYEKLECQVHCHRLNACQDREALEHVWQQVPKKLQQDAELLRNYAANLTRMGSEEQAEAMLRGFLKKHWDPLVVRLYGQLHGSDLNQQLSVTEHWLEEHEQHPELLLALGRLSLHNQLWGKARSYLEASLGMEPRAETCCELGNLLQQLGEKELAADYFRQGLQLVSGEQCTTINMPKPRELPVSEPEAAATETEEDEVIAPQADAPPPLSEENENK